MENVYSFHPRKQKDITTGKFILKNIFHRSSPACSFLLLISAERYTHPYSQHNLSPIRYANLSSFYQKNHIKHPPHSKPAHRRHWLYIRLQSIWSFKNILQSPRARKFPCMKAGVKSFYTSTQQRLWEKHVSDSWQHFLASVTNKIPGKNMSFNIMTLPSRIQIAEVTVSVSSLVDTGMWAQCLLVQADSIPKLSYYYVLAWDTYTFSMAHSVWCQTRLHIRHGGASQGCKC